MYKIEYGIEINDEGRPYIDLPMDYEQRPEDRFFVLEITRYMLQDLLRRRIGDLDPETVEAMDVSERLLGQLGDEVSRILYGQMRAIGDLKFDLNTGGHHVIVETIEERDNLPNTNIIFNGEIYDRREGLVVIVKYANEDDIAPTDVKYKLVDGITNENWIEI